MRNRVACRPSSSRAPYGHVGTDDRAPHVALVNELHAVVQRLALGLDLGRDRFTAERKSRRPVEPVSTST